MSKIKLFLLILALLSTLCYSQNPGLKAGDPLPNPMITFAGNYDNPVKSSLYDYKNDNALLIVLMPDITESNPYAKIIATGIDAYFAEGLSFRSFEQYRYINPELKVLVITNNNTEVLNEYMDKYRLDFDAAADEGSELANYFGINKWNGSPDASHIYIAGNNNNIIYAGNDFKGEGEKLKEVQSQLFAAFGLDDPVVTDNNYTALIPGDDERDFEFEFINNIITAGGNYSVSKGKLSDYIGKKNVLLAFYPAPFSMSCAAEVTKFDTFAEEKMLEKFKGSVDENVELLMISVSNYYILSKWKMEMGFDNVKLVNDPAGDISMKYNSYNIFGWNKRTVFLISREGKI